MELGTTRQKTLLLGHAAPCWVPICHISMNARPRAGGAGRCGGGGVGGGRGWGGPGRG